MNKKVIIIGSIVFLTAGICFATVFDFYLKMHGTAETTGPEFYIGSAKEETLLVNGGSPDCGHFYIKDQYRTFKTADLGGVSFNYVPKAKFYVRAKVVGSGSQDIRVSTGYYKESDPNNPYYLCSEMITVEPEMRNYTTDFITCAEAPKNVGKFFYEFEEVCEEGEECDGIEYIIGKCAGGFYTKVELQK